MLGKRWYFELLSGAERWQRLWGEKDERHKTLDSVCQAGLVSEFHQVFSDLTTGPRRFVKERELGKMI